MLTFIYDDFFGSIGLNLLMWSEFGRSWPFWPMRGLGIQRTHAFSRHVSSGAKKHLISSHTLIVNTCFPLHYVGHTWQLVATKWCYGVHLQFEVIEVLFGSVFSCYPSSIDQMCVASVNLWSKYYQKSYWKLGLLRFRCMITGKCTFVDSLAEINRLIACEDAVQSLSNKWNLCGACSLISHLVTINQSNISITLFKFMFNGIDNIMWNIPHIWSECGEYYVL